jgi:hypothetical protein
MPVDRGGAGGAGYQLAPGSWRKLLRATAIDSAGPMRGCTTIRTSRS